MFLQGQPILVVAAHPDDEVLGCGGFIHKAVRSGCKVYCIFMTPGVDNGALLAATTLEVNAASSVLGYELYPQFAGECDRDNRLDTLPFIVLVQFIENAIKKINPHIVVTHSKNELNIDHKLTYQAVVTATRPTTCQVRGIITFAVPEAVIYTYDSSGFKPTLFVSLLPDDLQAKLAALQAYKSRIRGNFHPREAKNIEAWTQVYGCYAGSAYAEPFEVIRWTI